MTADPEGDGRYPETGFKKALLDAAKPSGLRVLGPGSTGIQVPGIALNASWIATAAKPGRLAMVSQSGSLIAGVMEWAAARGIGCSHVISAGDAADIDIADLLDYLAADAAARAILLYVRSIHESRKFLSAARAAARAKPVIVLKAGRRLGADGEEVTALAPDEVFDAAIRRAGMLRVYDIDELFDAVQTLACVRLQGWQGGESLAILCNGSGPGEIAADRLVAGGGRLAPLSAATEAALAALIPGGWRGGDPVDLGHDALPSRFAEAATLLLHDDGVDALLVMHTPTARAAAAATAEAVTRVAREYKRTVLACWLGLGDADKAAIRSLFAEAHIPVYRTPEKAARGFLHLIRYHRNQAMLLQTPALPPAGTRAANRNGHAIIVAALQQGRGVLDDAEAGELLAAYGIERVADRAGGLSLTAGMAVDPIFGPVIRFGLGGALSQLVGDRALALPPLNLSLARELVSRTRIGRSILTAERAPLVAVEPLLVLLVQL
ncbi:MAG TPA: acetate--CoA ligase family protein, partial [Frankiaceae bacterium]|nr:acetate--CoA ligase family protein [Frankiaceae bacterium]